MCASSRQFDLWPTFSIYSLPNPPKSIFTQCNQLVADLPLLLVLTSLKLLDFWLDLNFYGEKHGDPSNLIKSKNNHQIFMKIFSKTSKSECFHNFVLHQSTWTTSACISRVIQLKKLKIMIFFYYYYYASTVSKISNVLKNNNSMFRYFADFLQSIILGIYHHVNQF